MVSFFFASLLGTWVKSSFVVRSRPFVVSPMGSVIAQHYNVSCYDCYPSSFCGVHYGFCNRTALQCIMLCLLLGRIAYFSDGLKPPTSNNLLELWFHLEHHPRNSKCLGSPPFFSAIKRPWMEGVQNHPILRG